MGLNPRISAKGIGHNRHGLDRLINLSVMGKRAFQWRHRETSKAITIKKPNLSHLRIAANQLSQVSLFDLGWRPHQAVPDTRRPVLVPVPQTPPVPAALQGNMQWVSDAHTEALENELSSTYVSKSRCLNKQDSVLRLSFHVSSLAMPCYL